MQEKVWVVTHIQGSEVTDASVFDSKADAENYAEEMAAANIGTYNVVESVHNSRKAMEEDSIRWTSLPELGAECIECLVEELAEETEEKFDEEACAKFFEEKKEELQKKADEMVHEYLRRELRDYINNERVILG